MKVIYPAVASLLLIGAMMHLMAGAPAQPPAAKNVLSKEDDTAIRQVLADSDEAWNTHNMKALDKVFHEDAEFINVVGMHWHGRADIIVAHAAFHATIFKDVDIKTDAIALRPLGTDTVIAVVTCTQDTFTTPSGEVVKKHQNKLSYVFTKVAGLWRIAHGQNVRIDAEAAKYNPADKKVGLAEEDLKALPGTWVTTKVVSDGKWKWMRRSRRKRRRYQRLPTMGISG